MTIAEFVAARHAEESGEAGRAKRYLAEIHAGFTNPSLQLRCRECRHGSPRASGDTFAAWPCRTFRALAAEYADHPDFHLEWIP
jgi:hypothetical protein